MASRPYMLYRVFRHEGGVAHVQFWSTVYGEMAKHADFGCADLIAFPWDGQPKSLEGEIIKALRLLSDSSFGTVLSETSPLGKMVMTANNFGWQFLKTGNVRTVQDILSTRKKGPLIETVKAVTVF